jgi:hypothetical protein
VANSFKGSRTPFWSLRTLWTALILLALPGISLATVITAFPQDFTVKEGTAFDANDGFVATFSDDNPAASPGDFNATIDWGDGSPPTPGTIVIDDPNFGVIGAHTYADEGSYTVTITIMDNAPGTGYATTTSTATITEADVLSGTPVTFSTPPGVSFNGNVANFSDTFTTNTANDFTAMIDWGDATTSPGTISGGSGAFHVAGTHTYAAGGNYNVVVTLSDDAPGTATAKVTSTAIVVADTVTTTAKNISTTEHSAFSGAVATFTAGNTTLTAAAFTATVDWGDGSTSPGTITGASGSFTVAAQHTYADEGSFTLSVTVTEVPPSTATSTSTATATVQEADVLSGTPVTFSASAGSAFNGAVAHFTDTDTVSAASDFTATINWGDGTTTPGTVSGGSGAFQVSGTHTYAGGGSYSVLVTLADDAPGSATASVTSTANVNTTLVTSAKAISATEHTAFSGVVATFTDNDTTKPASAYAATVAWGDGATTAGTITGAAGAFTVTGQHTYTDEGSFTLSVTASENAPGTAASTGTATAAVAEADVLTGTPVVFSASAGFPFNGTVGNFTDTDTASVASDFTATINWGDGTTTTGTVSGGAGSFHVGGPHAYANVGTYSVVVTLNDDAPGTATATVTSTANVGQLSVVPTPVLDRYGVMIFLLALVTAASCRHRDVRRRVRRAAD